MKIYDISMTLTEDMMVYGNNTENRPKIENTANHDTHSHYESKILMNLHNGTHIDAPLHMIKGGETMEHYSIDRFVADAIVIDLTHLQEMITEDDLKDLDIKKGDFLLFKTKNSWDTQFNTKFVFIERTAAAYLAQVGIKGVGIDSLGIERSQPDHASHITLMENDVLILEGLRLKDIEPGNYQLIVLPIKIANVEASPARAILIDKNA